MNNRNVKLFYSEEDEGWIADDLDLRYCSAFGNTPEEALAELQIAERLWLEAAGMVDGRTYEVWSPFDCAEAVQVLMKMLEEQR